MNLTPDELERFRANLRTLNKTPGLTTQAALADEIGINKSDLSRLLSTNPYKKRVTLRLLDRIATNLGMPIASLYAETAEFWHYYLVVHPEHLANDHLSRVTVSSRGFNASVINIKKSAIAYKGVYFVYDRDFHNPNKVQVLILVVRDLSENNHGISINLISKSADDSSIRFYDGVMRPLGDVLYCFYQRTLAPTDALSRFPHLAMMILAKPHPKGHPDHNTLRRGRYLGILPQRDEESPIGGPVLYRKVATINNNQLSLDAIVQPFLTDIGYLATSEASVEGRYRKRALTILCQAQPKQP